MYSPTCPPYGFLLTSHPKEKIIHICVCHMCIPIISNQISLLPGHVIIALQQSHKLQNLIKFQLKSSQIILDKQSTFFPLTFIVIFKSPTIMTSLQFPSIVIYILNIITCNGNNGKIWPWSLSNQLKRDHKINPSVLVQCPMIPGI